MTNREWIESSSLEQIDKERAMTSTKAEPIKRYCKSKQIMCELANNLGYCRISACAKPETFPKIPPTTTAIDAVLVETLKQIPEACKNCSNHPSNGGSGICFCTLGSMKITC